MIRVLPLSLRPADEVQDADQSGWSGDGGVPAPRFGPSDVPDVQRGEAEKDNRTDPFVLPRHDAHDQEAQRGEQVHEERQEHAHARVCGEHVEGEEGEQQHECETEDARGPEEDFL